MIFCARLSRIFVPLLGENERGVSLVVAETGVGRWHDFAAWREDPAAASARDSSRVSKVWKVSMNECDELNRRPKRVILSAAEESRGTA